VVEHLPSKHKALSLNSRDRGRDRRKGRGVRSIINTKTATGAVCSKEEYLTNGKRHNKKIKGLE
jgi:hypothetical protein